MGVEAGVSLCEDGDPVLWDGLGVKPALRVQGRSHNVLAGQPRTVRAVELCWLSQLRLGSPTQRGWQAPAREAGVAVSLVSSAWERASCRSTDGLICHWAPGGVWQCPARGCAARPARAHLCGSGFPLRRGGHLGSGRLGGRLTLFVPSHPVTSSGL